MNSRLLSIKITGRTATAAVYFGRELHYVEVRQLASELAQAKDSLIAFSSSLIEHFRVDSAASEERMADTRAEEMTTALIALLRDKVIPHWAIEKPRLFAAYGEPPLKSVQELRGIVSNYWPHVIEERDDKTCLDAAALGLYLQTERLLSDNSPPSQ